MLTNELLYKTTDEKIYKKESQNVLTSILW